MPVWKVIPGVVASVACTTLLGRQLADTAEGARAGGTGAGTWRGKQAAGGMGAVALLSGGAALESAPGQLIAPAGCLQSLLGWKAACVGAGVRDSQQRLHRYPLLIATRDY